ncbi:MAG: hypothetical protein ACLPSL_14995 [Smithella sp.]|jgi:hypothetical protein
MNPNQKIVGVFQYFYHCSGEELPIRDILNRQKHGHKTEPHYENLTENWCSECMNGRIKSANHRNLKYLFLITRYRHDNHLRNGKLLVVGFLYRADDKKVWHTLSESRLAEVDGFNSEKPEQCGFFVGDEKKSHFVSADKAFVLDDVKNGRWKYFAYEDEAGKIVDHLKKSKNILEELRKKVKEFENQTNKERHEKRCKTC